MDREAALRPPSTRLPRNIWPRSDRKITDLRALRRETEQYDQSMARCGTVAECRIIEALSGRQ